MPESAGTRRCVFGLSSRRPTRRLWREGPREQYVLAWTSITRFLLGWMKPPPFAISSGERMRTERRMSGSASDKKPSAVRRVALIAYSTLLCIRRTAGTVRISAANRCAVGEIPRTRRRGRRQLRSAQVRRPVGDGIGDGEAAVSGPDLREASLRGLQKARSRSRYARSSPSTRRSSSRSRSTRPTSMSPRTSENIPLGA